MHPAAYRERQECAPARNPDPGMDDATRLVMTDVAKRFGSTHALRGVNLTLRAGEVHALVGENGAGKSTLMKILSGAERPDGGRMTLDGHPYAPAGPLDARRLGVAMIYQELTLAPHLSVEANVLLGLEPTRYGFLRRGDGGGCARPSPCWNTRKSGRTVPSAVLARRRNNSSRSPAPCSWTCASSCSTSRQAP